MFPHKYVFFLVFAVFTAGISAQNADDYLDYGESAEELVITASRISEAIKDVPAQITVISADDIAQSGAASVVDVLETVPGIRFSGAMAGAGSETISMRGFGENSYGRVLVLVDGNKINDPDMKAANWNAIPLSSIERIEILDGSASVLYGNNAVGGVVNIITKQGGTRQTIVDIAGGSFYYNREALSHFQPLSWGHFMLSAEHSGTRGYRDRQEAQAVNTYASTSVFIGDTMQLSFNGFFSWLHFQLPGSLTEQEYKDNPKQAVNPDDENNEFHFGGGLSFRWFPAEHIEFMLPLSYRGKSIEINMSSYYLYGGGFTDRTVHTAEARPQGSVTFDIADMPLRLLGGVDLYYTRLGADIYDDKNRDTLSTSYTISQWTIGPYITAHFSPLSTLSFSTGGRFDTAITKAENLAGDADGDKIFHVFVYDAGLVYNPLDTMKLYARYAALFRYPFVDELAQVSGLGDRFNTDLKPEKGFNAEIGSSWELEDFLNISANFFFMQLEDEIAVIYDGWDPININFDKTQHWGANLGLQINLLDLISVNASYSFVNAVFIDGDFKDKQLPLVPNHKIYGSLMVHLPFGLSFGPDIEYTSSRYYAEDFTNDAGMMDGYFLLGVRARFVLDKDRKRFALQITAKNLLNTNHTSYGGVYESFTPPPVWEYYIYPADGRSINVSLQYRF